VLPLAAPRAALSSHGGVLKDLETKVFLASFGQK
jgi:hypothetical protein